MDTNVEEITIQLVPGIRDHKPKPPKKATITVTCRLNQTGEPTFDLSPNRGDVELPFNSNPEEFNVITFELVDLTELGIKFVNEEDRTPFFVKTKPPAAPEGTLFSRRISDTKLKVYNENGPNTPHSGVWWEFKYCLRLEGSGSRYKIDPIIDDEPGP
jgi:hypothetical protein